MRTASAIASGRLSVGAVPGFASLATTSGTPAARSAATGGGACAEREARDRQEDRGDAGLRERAMPGGVDVLEVIGRARADLRAELRAADVGELADVQAHAEPGALRRLADDARLVDA